MSKAETLFRSTQHRGIFEDQSDVLCCMVGVPGGDEIICA